MLVKIDSDVYFQVMNKDYDFMEDLATAWGQRMAREVFDGLGTYKKAEVNESILAKMLAKGYSSGLRDSALVGVLMATQSSNELKAARTKLKKKK